MEKNNGCLAWTDPVGARLLGVGGLLSPASITSTGGRSLHWLAGDFLKNCWPHITSEVNPVSGDS